MAAKAKHQPAAEQCKPTYLPPETLLIRAISPAYPTGGELAAGDFSQRADCVEVHRIA
jgi:hypothetical protein